MVVSIYTGASEGGDALVLLSAAGSVLSGLAALLAVAMTIIESRSTRRALKRERHIRFQTAQSALESVYTQVANDYAAALEAGSAVAGHHIARGLLPRLADMRARLIDAQTVDMTNDEQGAVRRFVNEFHLLAANIEAEAREHPGLGLSLVGAQRIILRRMRAALVEIIPDRAADLPTT